MVRIWVDGEPHEVTEDGNVLETCLQLGYDLPYFCWHPALGSVGACRQCAVIQHADEQDARGRIVMGCMTRVTDGMRLSLQASGAVAFRAGIIELLMTNHPHDCPVCEEGGECHLQDMTLMTGHHSRRYHGRKRTHRNQDLGPFLNHEMNRCIACYRCTRFYRDYAGGEDLQAQASASRVYFGRDTDGALENAFSGNLAEVCPTGVFTDRVFSEHYTRKWDLQTAPSVCTHCSLGCNVTPAERYGSLRRVQNRYNGAVNGYFICDRGRYGWQHVAAPARVRTVMRRGESDWESVPAETAFAGLKKGQKLLGIGSPRASVEANFALRELVGADAFSMGVGREERAVLLACWEILGNTSARVVSLREIEQADAVLVLGEDLAHSAPRMALSIRQATRNAGFDRAEAAGIPHWQDQSVRILAQDLRSPLFVAAPHGTGLDRLCSGRISADPCGLENIATAIAHALDPRSRRAPRLDDAARGFVDACTAALSAAKRPVVISGAGLRSVGLLEATANIARALQSRGADAGIALVLPECNSLASAALGGVSVEALAGQADDAVLIVLENDLYRRTARDGVDALLRSVREVIVVDHTRTAVAEAAHRLLPAAAFGEGDGTYLNNESRAQRAYQVLLPEAPIRESWRWLTEMARALGLRQRLPWTRQDEVLAACVAAVPALAGLEQAAPGAGFRPRGLRFPRQPHRYSGRTAMNAARSVHEPRPPQDADAPFSWSMEGDPGPRPAALIASTWSPGWNSVQSWNKFQDEIGGALRGGDAGHKLIHGHAPDGAWYAGGEVPQDPGGAFWIVARPHVFVSDELSARGDAIRARQPAAACGMHPEDAAQLGLEDGGQVELRLPDGSSRQLKLAVSADIARGLACVPLDAQSSGWNLPARGAVSAAGGAP